LLAAGSFGGWYFFVRSNSTPGTTIQDDGPNFYQVLAKLNGSVENESGGPWSLFSAVGIASQGEFSPNVKGYYNLNLSVNSCQFEMNGSTLWNGTMPVFAGTFNSGTAPFWQLAYFSNTTKEVLVATSSSGISRVFAPIPISRNCTLSWTDFRLNPNLWASQIEANSSLPVNSPAAAQTVWSKVDTNWIGRNAPLVEVLTLGPAMFEATQDIYRGNWGVDFIGCGIAGVTGQRPLISAGTDRNGQWAGELNGTTNCAATTTQPELVQPLAYNLLFSNSTITNGTTTAQATARFQVAFSYPNGTLTGDFDGWGLADWMTSLNLTGGAHQLLSLGASGCPNWVPSDSDCAANSSGWYAVLLSAGGEWLASYGATQHGAGWTVAVTAIVSHQQLVIVLPSSWSTSGDSLEIGSTTAYSVIQGSFLL